MTASDSTRFARQPGLGPLLGIRILRAALWLLVAAGPATAALLAVQVHALRDRVDAVGRSAAVELPADTSAVEGFAELLVANFLGADVDGPPSRVGSGGDGSTGLMEHEPLSKVRTASFGAERLAPGYFAVTVAAELLGFNRDPDDGPSTVPVGIRFYTVGVVETESGWVAVGPPALVAAPRSAPQPDLLVGGLGGLGEVAGLEEAVSRFFAAYLAGEGELARYVAPGSDLTPVQPPPFTTVEVLEAGSATLADGGRQVVVLVEGTDGAGRVEVLQYALVAARREGRWEVVELLPAPSLATTDDS